MKFVICKHGQTRPGDTTVTLERGRSTVVFRRVPAEVCENCGERYVDAETTKKLLADAERAAQAGVEVELRSYVAACIGHYEPWATATRPQAYRKEILSTVEEIYVAP